MYNYILACLTLIFEYDKASVLPDYAIFFSPMLVQCLVLKSIDEF